MLVAEFEQFLGSWSFIRGMTKDFVKATPAEAWEKSPLPNVASIAKQVRHLVCVSGTYNRALATGKMSMAGKHDFYSGILDRADLLAALEKTEIDLLNALRGIEPRKVADFRVDFFGGEMTFAEFTHVMIQHESIHQGLWAAYARAGGFPTPASWVSNWKL